MVPFLMTVVMVLPLLVHRPPATSLLLGTVCDHAEIIAPLAVALGQNGVRNFFRESDDCSWSLFRSFDLLSCAILHHVPLHGPLLNASCQCRLQNCPRIDLGKSIEPVETLSILLHTIGLHREIVGPFSNAMGFDFLTIPDKFLSISRFGSNQEWSK